MEVLVTLTTDVGRVLSKLHHVQPKGKTNFLTGIKIAHVRHSLVFLFGSAIAGEHLCYQHTTPK